MADHPNRIFQHRPKAGRCGREHAGSARARVHQDLEDLRVQPLPVLGNIEESPDNDYRFRAMAPRAKVSADMVDIVGRLDYSNFKSQVAKVQGPKRAHLYHEVCDVLYRLQKI